MAGIAAILIVPLLNPTIFGRAAYFLPIPLFLLVAVSNRRIVAFTSGPSLRLRVAGALFIGLIVVGFSIGDFYRLQSATVYNQILNESTLQALDWISLHTVRTDTLFTNYQGLGGWIAGYSQRDVISPRPLGYIVTSPDYEPTVAANAIDAGNYVLDGKSLTIGDFFPSSIFNPAVYLNLPTGRQGLLFLDDDYQTVYPNATTGLPGSRLVSASSKTLSNASVEGSRSFTFNYSWEFGAVSRTVSLTPPNSIGVSYSISVAHSNETVFVARILAFSGEAFDYSRLSENMARLRALLPNGQAIAMSIGYNGTLGDSIISSFSGNDSITKLPTLSVRLSSHSSTTRLNFSISLLDLSFSDPVSSYTFLNLVRSYSVDYLVLDVQAYSQNIRFKEAGFASVYQNSRISILKINL
jgi:hypothetical protein